MGSEKKCCRVQGSEKKEGGSNKNEGVRKKKDGSQKKVGPFPLSRSPRLCTHSHMLKTRPWTPLVIHFLLPLTM